LAQSDGLFDPSLALESKARITARFLRHKVAEYEKLQIEIETMRREVKIQRSLF